MRLDLSTGKTLWKEQGEFSDAGPILIRDGALYVSHGKDGVFSKLDLSTGRTLWKKVDWNYNIWWGPIIPLPGGQVAARNRDGGLDIFACDTGEFSKYGPADHPPITTDPNTNFYSHIDSFLSDHELLYAGGCSGGSGVGACMSAFEPRTRKQKWLTAIHEKSIRVALPSPAGPPVLHENQLIFALDTEVV